MQKFGKENHKRTGDLYKLFFPEERKSSKWMVPIALALALTAGEVYLMNLANGRKAHLAEIRRNPSRESILEQRCRTEIPMDPAEARILVPACREVTRK